MAIDIVVLEKILEDAKAHGAIQVSIDNEGSWRGEWVIRAKGNGVTVSYYEEQVEHSKNTYLKRSIHNADTMLVISR